MATRATSRKAGESATQRKAKKPASRKAQKPAEPSAYTVFISHSSKEKWIARQISKEIIALGAKTWLDLNDLQGGDEIRRSIRLGIRASQEVVVLLSPHSIISPWVVYEGAIADDQGKRITPIFNNLAPSDIPAPLQGIKAIDLNNFDVFLVELAERIRNHLGKSRKAAS